jgi:RNA polymerase sigma factor (sigma-70 family)
MMSSHLVFNGVEDDLKARLEEYWQKKLPRLEKRLVPYRPDLQEIRLTVYRHKNSRREWFEVRGVIHLPTGTLAVEEENVDAFAALDGVVDRVTEEIKRHKELVRKDYVFKRKGRHRADLSAAGPLLLRDAEGGRREDFFWLLRPRLGDLRDHARREISILERKGKLHPGEVEVEDLLDEVLVRAWERFPKRPQVVPLNLWLIRLLHETLESWTKGEPRPHKSLEEKAPSKPDKADEKEWWAELLGPPDMTTLGDLIVGDSGEGNWDEMDAEEQRDRVLSLLAELPAAQRQAFLLHVLEDYDTAEIAMIQDRPESEVKADIESARQTLKERLTLAEMAK